MKKLFLILALALGGSQIAQGHGEDKPGPHGGFIRMPGAFHTEVLLTGANNLQVYLLDLHWKNPTVKNSSVALSFDNGKRNKAKCEKKGSAFVCELPKGVDLQLAGKLLLTASRDGQKGVEVEYPTPLKR